MRKRLITSVVAGGAVLAASLSGAPARAGAGTSTPRNTASDATWTVSPGGTAKATITPGTLTLTDTRTGIMGTCQTSAVTGTVKSGSGLSGTDIGAATAVTFGSCLGQGSPFKVTAGDLPWQISFASYNPKLQVVRGTVSGIKVTLTGEDCDAVVNGTSGTTADGTVSAVYRDGIGQLTFLSGGGNLHYWHVDCPHLIYNGDPVTLTASYEIRPVQTITSP
jgi:hypothetical protein